MKNVLMINYFFPPLGNADSIQALRYVKYLPEFGWRPYILTVRQDPPDNARDEVLAAEIPPGAEIIRTRFIDIRQPSVLFRHFPSSKVVGGLDRLWACVPPDLYIGWLPFAYLQARKVIASQRIDAIYTLSSPHTVFLVGYLLKRTTGLPWIAYFVDEWTRNPFYAPPLRWQRRVDAWFERQVIDMADRILIAWPGMRSLLASDISQKSTTITYSFDATDFQTPVDSTETMSKFCIVYAGSFYASQQPACFLLAIEELIKEGQLPADRLKLVFVGRVRSAGFANFENGPVGSIMEHVGFISHVNAIDYIKRASALLLIVSKRRGNANIPSKTFEYLASGKPILALVPHDGAAAELITRTRTGVVVDPEDIKAIKEAVLDLYRRWRSGGLEIQPDWTEIRKYEARVVTGRLVEVLDSLLP
jgi:glycosyltransferase involved in cell wall biosynthesis